MFIGVTAETGFGLSFHRIVTMWLMAAIAIHQLRVGVFAHGECTIRRRDDFFLNTESHSMMPLRPLRKWLLMTMLAHRKIYRPGCGALVVTITAIGMTIRMGR